MISFNAPTVGCFELVNVSPGQCNRCHQSLLEAPDNAYQKQLAKLETTEREYKPPAPVM
jgi:hypothetical protein